MASQEVAKFIDAYAQLNPGTVMEGVRLGGRGENLVIGDALRVVTSEQGRPVKVDVNIKGRLRMNGNVDLILLEEVARDGEQSRFYEVPTYAFGFRGDGTPWNLRRRKPARTEVRQGKSMSVDIEPRTQIEEVAVGQVIHGVSGRANKREAYFVAAIDEETGHPLLETFDRNPKRFELSIHNPRAKRAFVLRQRIVPQHGRGT